MRHAQYDFVGCADGRLLLFERDVCKASGWREDYGKSKYFRQHGQGP